jgi:hypothetical protein
MKLNLIFKAFLQIIVIVFATFLTGSAFADEQAQVNVCCEQTKQGEYCQYVPEGDCTSGVGAAPTSCDKTSYCDLGTCIDRDGEGYCYSNYPKATCESTGGIFQSEKNANKVEECAKGCCIIGTQADFVTENRCKTETMVFPDLTMDFRSDIKTEYKCLEVANRAQKGACVTDSGSCMYVTDAECDFTPKKISAALEGESNETVEHFTGFYPDKYCSQLAFIDPLCAPANPQIGGVGDAKDTGCIDGSDDVWWFDSCGNPEGVKEPCDYADGDLCGDNDNDGRYTCESTGCYGDKIQYPNQDIKFAIDESDVNYDNVKEGGVLNGESWCQYDYSLPQIKGGQKIVDFAADEEIAFPYAFKAREDYPFKLKSIKDNLRDISYASREPVGSRHYRTICINGEQLVEPCADYRKEWCLEGDVENKITDSEFDYTESRCVENRWQACIDECNTATPGMGEFDWKEAQKKDLECCSDYTKRDCAWAGGKCTPRIAPGARFWEEEGEGNCGKASMECSFLVKCDGWNSIFGQCDDSGNNVVSGGWRPVTPTGEEISINDVPCLKDEDGVPGADFIQASNNLCRSHGDCGASYNVDGDYTYGGFYSPDNAGKNFNRMIGDRLEDAQIDQNNKPNWEAGWSILDTRLKGASYGGFFKDFLWINNPDVYARWFGYSSLITFQGILGALDTVWPQAYGETFKSGVFSGFMGWDKLTKKGILEKAGAETTQELGKNALKEAGTAKITEEMAKNKGEEIMSKELGKATTSGLVKALNIVMWGYMIYDIGNNVFAKTQTVTIKTECKPWVAPKGGDDCEKCNPDFWLDSSGNPTSTNAFKACSEYRCKSYGATCGLVNKGTSEETCVGLHPYDVNSPLIDPWVEGLGDNTTIDNLDYGYFLRYLGGEIPIYTPVNLAIQTNEPAQCKMSFDHSVQFDSMEPTYFGGPIYKYFHTQSIFYPSSTNVTDENLKMTEGGAKEYQVYVRCVDASGNANDADYVIKYGVSREPDITAPIIHQTSIDRDSYLSAGANETSVTVYVNEPSTCRWALMPVAYDEMEVSNECNTNIGIDALGFFECDMEGSAKLTGLGGNTGDVKNAYFKCRDDDGNTNKEPYSITLRGSEILNITSIYPNGKLDVAIGEQTVVVGVTTEGGAIGDGTSTCKYTRQESVKENVHAMDDTLEMISPKKYEKELTLPTGNHRIYVGCVDDAGNVDYAETEFSMTPDLTPPGVVKSYWNDGEGINNLVVVLNEEARCQDSLLDFEFGEGSVMIKDGVVHETTTESDYYYVLCNDSYGNAHENPYFFQRVK